MKVHVTLRDAVRKDPIAKELAFEKVVRTCEIQEVNRKRFDRYGIITGEIADANKLHELEGLDEVGTVERDAEKFAI